MDICKTQLQPNQVKKSGLQAGHQVEGLEELEELEEYTDEEKSRNYGLPCPTVGGLSGSVSICKIYL